MISREKLEENGDSISHFYNFALSLQLDDFLGAYEEKYLNGMPRFYMEAGYGWYEDIAAAGKETDRVVVSAKYRIFENQPVNLGLVINGGQGPDIIALTLSYGIIPSQFFKFLDK